MRVLILGATGYLGSRLFNIYTNEADVLGTFNRNLSTKSNMVYWDGIKMTELEILINHFKPNVVINCIGLTNVDSNEIFPEKAFLLNSIMPCEIGRICAKTNVKLVHISTDHFDRQSKEALAEDGLVICRNVYSLSKLLGEKYLLEVNPKSIILRTNFFHFTKNSDDTFLNKCINLASTNAYIDGFNDVIFSPVSTSYLKQSITSLINVNYSGVINVSSNESISKYDFLKEIFEVIGKTECNLRSLSVHDSGLLANRPQFMALSNRKYQMLTREKVPALKEMIKFELIQAKIIKQ
jgi:dTDP-4-dehydrorhamnose reductase